MKELRDLDGALCNFCNQVADPFEPVSKWDEFVRNAFIELARAYNAAYAAGCFPEHTDREAKNV